MVQKYNVDTAAAVHNI